VARIVLLIAFFGVGALACPVLSGQTTTNVRNHKNGKQPATSAPAVDLVGSGGQMTYTDQKTGKVLWTATANSLSARTGGKPGQGTGFLQGVHGVIYQKGAPADAFSAPNVSYDEHTQAVTATGGASLTSVRDSATSVRCDRLTWYPDTDQVVGQGNVVFRHGGFTQRGKSFSADTKLDTLVMPAHGTSIGKQGVHASWSPSSGNKQ
jgi:hypothetical protein